jgi:hypothetical protein
VFCISSEPAPKFYEIYSLVAGVCGSLMMMMIIKIIMALGLKSKHANKYRVELNYYIGL